MTASSPVKAASQDENIEKTDLPPAHAHDIFAHEQTPWYFRVPFASRHAPPPPKSLDDAPLTPEVSANIYDKLTLGWMYPILAVGYARPLQQTDLWRIDEARSADEYCRRIDDNFARRVREANEYNERLEKGEIKVGWIKRTRWYLTSRGDEQRKEKEKTWREKEGRKKPSLFLALNDSVKAWYWSGMLFKVLADTAQITSPLVTKEIIRFSTQSYAYYKGHRTVNGPPNMGRGIALAIGLLLMSQFATLCNAQCMYRLMMTGAYLRTGLISSIFKQSLRLSNKSRSRISNGKLIAHISTDVTRIDFAAGHSMGFTAPIQLLICLGLLIANLGYSAFAGFGIFIIFIPLQTRMIKTMFAKRGKSMVFTDQRSKLLQEVLSGIRIIKYFAWEVPFLNRIRDIRYQELRFVRTLMFFKSATLALAFSLPVFASAISFITYSLTGHSLDPAIIFTALSYFDLLRIPLLMFPASLNAGTDAYNAIGRLQELYESEVLMETKLIDEELDVAIRVQDANFTWDAPPPATEKGGDKKGGKGQGKASDRSKGKVKEGETEIKEEAPVFQLKNINLEIPKGKLIAIVGPVGSGKSSLLQGLIGEMKRTSGTVKFGGSIAYCSQTAWIQSCSIRDNVLFGMPMNEERYTRVIRDSQLVADLAMLPAGDLTEVGERGISLSGGQKQRINIARALYRSVGTVATIFDDPFSALDAHVGKAVFHDVFQVALADTTRLVVTHALHFLPSCDYIITLDGTGTIVEFGTHQELMANGGAFARLTREFGGSEELQEEEEKVKDDTPKKLNTVVPSTALMQEEERNTGVVDGGVYWQYFMAGNGQFLVPWNLFVWAVLNGATVLTSYWLVWWLEREFPLPNGAYMAVFGVLGLTQALLTFVMGASLAFTCFYASKKIHLSTVKSVLYAPVSFFDTTPLGRIMNRFSKDIDTIDNVLGDAFRFGATTFGRIIATFVLIAVVFPWILLPIVAISSIYIWASNFYRASAREFKRLDALLRSSLYSHYAESISGLATIRAYGDGDRFLKENRARMDIENRAYFLSIGVQRWLGFRLESLGNILAFAVSIIAVVTKGSISPAQVGLVLSYMITVQQSFATFVRQFAEIENNMNSVERLLHYSHHIEQEPPHEIPGKRPPNWPSSGQLQFDDVQMSYRPGLPLVLKSLSFNIKAGEHVGIVGRTGAGKSSIMASILRVTELSGGTIKLDGVDISEVGLDDLRKHIAIIPQDPLLFSGTIRSNLDPFEQYDDQRLWDALRWAHLVDNKAIEAQDGPNGSAEVINRFTLDTRVEEEGSNLSVGQRSLVSLARAIVIPSAITLLDEATASVDYATDQLIQQTISEKFADRTLLCIAHRLRTIIGYDRVCVLDAGTIVEFDTPENLFDIPGGIFRGMCDRSGILKKDIRAAQSL